MKKVLRNEVGFSGLLKHCIQEIPGIRRIAISLLVSAFFVGCAGSVTENSERVVISAPSPVSGLEQYCQTAVLREVASSLAIQVSVTSISNGPRFVDGSKYFPATDRVPEFCQVTGSFVTNPDTGKTANFLATFPAAWNGKYLQMGCSGHCGQFAVSDVAQAHATITNQGYPFQPIIKGYAVFATDEGHEGMNAGTWAIRKSGGVDEDAIEDLYQRATRVLSVMGKDFTRAFYATAMSEPHEISYSYFNGCSGGGRDAFVAASHYPEAFDGIIAGSAYDTRSAAFQMAAIPIASIRSDAAYVPPELVNTIDTIVKAQCDDLDGVSDGVIQNPAACNFLPERDLPRCAGGESANNCFTKAQIETVSVALTAVTDEDGNVVQPGFSVSEIQAATFLTPPRLENMDSLDPFPNSDDGSLRGGYWPLADAMLKVFVHKNDPGFHTRSIVSFTEGGSGDITAFRAVVPKAEVKLLRKEAEAGIGHNPEKIATLIKQGRKFLIWHNMSDQTLTPYMSINYYKQLAAMYGGYKKLQKNIRLFPLPGTGHCSMMGVGPNSFDALGAMENWVEKGEAPDALLAKQFPNNAWGMIEFDKPALRTMPLCKFPEMARYKGEGNVNDAASWYCPKGDTRMLVVGESGRQAGVLD